MTGTRGLGGHDPVLVLAETLRLAVACHMAEMRGLDAAGRRRRVPYGAAELVGCHGDALQWRGKDGRPQRGTAAVFNALAAGLAALAAEDGGVSFHGVHACTRDHPGCPHTRPPTPVPAGDWWEPLAELEALLAAEDSGTAPGGVP